jgi:hypothetical protein
MGEFRSVIILYVFDVTLYRTITFWWMNIKSNYFISMTQSRIFIGLCRTIWKILNFVEEKSLKAEKINSHWLAPELQISALNIGSNRYKTIFMLSFSRTLVCLCVVLTPSIMITGPRLLIIIPANSCQSS